MVKANSGGGGLAEPGPTRGLDRGDLDSLVGPSVRVVRNILTNRIVTAHAALGARPGLFNLLTLIAFNPGCSQTDLAREAGLDKSAVLQLLDELVARDCIRRVRSDADRRRYELAITPVGTAFRQALLPVTVAVEQPLRDTFSTSELELLRSMLERARDALEAGGMGASRNVFGNRLGGGDNGSTMHAASA